ncbi:MAG: hypothetical protein K2Q33_02855 [Gammaproteobacteria bacterium]|nr:hypothetical protein [Gammaproteobacteria bacterium]
MNIPTKIQLNRQQLDGLYSLVEWLLQNYPASDNAEQLLDDIIEGVRKKIRTKVESFSNRNSYSISLKRHEALAYFIWMQQLEPFIPKGLFVYELSVSSTLTNKIDMTYGTINGAKSNTLSLPQAN